MKQLKTSLKALSLLLLAISIVLFSGCNTNAGKTLLSENTEETSEQSTEPVAEPVPSKIEIAEKALSLLPEYDFEGKQVVIVTSDKTTVLPSDTASVVNQTRYTRLNELENRYNFKISTNYDSAYRIFLDAQASHKSELFYADLLYVGSSSLWRFTNADLAFNITSIPFVNTNAPYFNQNSMAQASVSNRTYAAIGESNYNYDYLNGVFFNKDLLSSITDASVYDDVYAGTWTLNRMLELSRLATKDMNGAYTGTTAVTTKEDQYSIIDSLFFAANGPVVDTDRGKLPVCTPFDDASQTYADIISALMYEKNSFKISKTADNDFAKQTSLFYIGPLSEMKDLANSEFDWGVLPMPKGKQSEYRSLSDGYFPVTIVPSVTSNFTRSGILLEGFNATLYGYAENAYFNDALRNHIRDGNTLNMIELIKNGTSCDFAHMFSNGITDLSLASFDGAVNSVRTKRRIDYYNRYTDKVNERLSAAFAE